MLVKLTMNLGPGKKVEVLFHKGEDVEKIAEAFVKEHGLESRRDKLIPFMKEKVALAKERRAEKIRKNKEKKKLRALKDVAKQSASSSSSGTTGAAAALPSITSTGNDKDEIGGDNEGFDARMNESALNSAAAAAAAVAAYTEQRHHPATRQRGASGGDDGSEHQTTHSAVSPKASNKKTRAQMRQLAEAEKIAEAAHRALMRSRQMDAIPSEGNRHLVDVDEVDMDEIYRRAIHETYGGTSSLLTSSSPEASDRKNARRRSSSSRKGSNRAKRKNPSSPSSTPLDHPESSHSSIRPGTSSNVLGSPLQPADRPKRSERPLADPTYVSSFYAFFLFSFSFSLSSTSSLFHSIIPSLIHSFAHSLTNSPPGRPLGQRIPIPRKTTHVAHT